MRKINLEKRKKIFEELELKTETTQIDETNYCKKHY